MRPPVGFMLAVYALGISIDASPSHRGLLEAEATTNVTHTITDADGEWQLVHNITVQPSVTPAMKISDLAATPSPDHNSATQQSTSMTGPIAIGAIGILAVGIAAAVAHKKRNGTTHG